MLKSALQIWIKKQIDLQLLSFFPILKNSFLCSLDSELGLAMATAINNSMAKVEKAHPTRFLSLITLPLQDVDVAVDELDRAVKDLGMKGVALGSNVGGRNLDSVEFWPFYQKVQQLDVPIVVHPTTPFGIERMPHYHLQNLIGNPAETSLCIASIIFGGVLETFPNLKFCFVHGGGFIPYQRGRLEHGYKVRSECKIAISKPPSEYLKLIYIDTITHSQLALKYLIEAIGSEKVLMGSDYDADMSDPNPVSTVKALEFLSSKEKEQILGKTAAKLFKIS